MTINRTAHWKAKVKPMTATGRQIPFRASLSVADVDRARSGLWPVDMDDKWVGLYSENSIDFYRSWTAHQIFHLRLRRTEDSFEVGPIEVIDDPAVYRRIDDATDVTMVTSLLERLTRSHLSREDRPDEK